MGEECGEEAPRVEEPGRGGGETRYVCPFGKVPLRVAGLQLLGSQLRLGKQELGDLIVSNHRDTFLSRGRL